MRCMESLTAFKIPRMEESASCRSSHPSHPLLYFNSSCEQKVGIQRDRNKPAWVQGEKQHGSPSAGAGTWLFSGRVSGGRSPSQVYVPASSGTPGSQKHPPTRMLRSSSFLEATWEGRESGAEGYLEEGTVGALSPQALRAGFILAVRLVDLQVLHLQRDVELGTSLT